MRKIFKAKQDIEDVLYIEVDSDGAESALQVQGQEGALAKPQHKLLPKWPHIQDESQKKALGNILKFMALVLVFTIVARGAAGATLAKVDTVTPYPGEIVESLQANGTVQAASSLPITAPAGLTLKEVLVVPGQTVSIGDAIARFDTEEIAEGRQRAQLDLDEMNLNLQKLERGETYDGSALTNAQNALTWAEQDYNNTQATGNAAIAAAQTALNNALSTLDALRRSAADAAAPPASDSDVNADPNSSAPAGPSPADIAAAEAAVTAAQTALDSAVRDADVALQGAARAIETARLNLASAQQADAETRQGIADAAAQNALDAEALRLDIEKQQAVIASYDTIRDGTITAGIDGTVLEVAIAGAVADENAVAVISNVAGGYIATADIPEADAAKLPNGAQVNVSIPQGYYDGGNPIMATLLSISSPTGNGMVRITVRLPAGEWKHGQAVQLEAVLSRQQYQSCVPLSALGQGQEGYFVYVMEERSGVLGTENVVRKVPVTLLARDANMAAIEGGIFGGERVISWTSKPLADGDKVRVRQV